jgi:RNA polymerase sigma-70 factor (ECF subfamily)
VSSSSTPVSPDSTFAAADQDRWFAENVRPHERALRGFLRGRVPSSADVDDVVQDSYLKILQARHGAGIVSIKAYLFAIARNTAAKLFRKQRIFSPVPVAELPAWRVWDGGQDAAETANANLQHALVAEAIATLPARRREIVLSCVADGLSSTEIALRLGISESTVRTQLSRGVATCTEYLRERGVISPP